jgi:hypothetical protein
MSSRPLSEALERNPIRNHHLIYPWWSSSILSLGQPIKLLQSKLCSSQNSDPPAKSLFLLVGPQASSDRQPSLEPQTLMTKPHTPHGWTVTPPGQTASHEHNQLILWHNPCLPSLLLYMHSPIGMCRLFYYLQSSVAEFHASSLTKCGNHTTITG